MSKQEKEVEILNETLRAVRAPNRARVESPIGPTKEVLWVIDWRENVMILVLGSNLEISAYSVAVGEKCVQFFEWSLACLLVALGIAHSILTRRKGAGARGA